jgi:hypothetical protein
MTTQLPQTIEVEKKDLKHHSPKLADFHPF